MSSCSSSESSSSESSEDSSLAAALGVSFLAGVALALAGAALGVSVFFLSALVAALGFSSSDED